MEYTEINDELEKLIEKIAYSLRGVTTTGKKRIEKKAIEQLFHLINSRMEVFQNEDKLDKRFVALLFYLHIQVNTEARFTNYPDPIYRLSGEIEDILTKLFGPALT